MTLSGRVALTVSTVLAVGLVGAVALYLNSTQSAARDKVSEDLANRATLAAQLTAGAVASSLRRNQDYAEQTFGGPPGDVQAAVDADWKAAPQTRIIVLGADGTALGTYPRALRKQRDALMAAPEIRSALAQDLGLSDVHDSPDGPLIMQAIRYHTAHGDRVWSSSVPATDLSALGESYLSGALGIQGGQAYLLDARDRILATSGDEQVGARPDDAALLSALRVARSGEENGRLYVSAPMAGSSWRVVFAAPIDTLMAPVAATRRAAWRLFGVIVGAMLLVLSMVAFALRSSARLAHERLHDTLTGLPNRALFIEHTEHALAALQRRGGHLAALFVDLDRFKAVNDVHGHAVGDALLSAVATRLRRSVRSGDVVSRFGGDEFVVLCPDVDDAAEATWIAERIQALLAPPLHIDGRKLEMTCSIGIAVHSGNGDQIDAAALIHKADLAMYRAKQDGRAGVEQPARWAA